MNMLFSTILFTLILRSLCQKCPSIYLRYSKEHSFCKPRNPSCRILKSGLTADMRIKVLDAHNKHRSKVAMGKESRAGGLPQASDMMQMVWDNELESVIQKHLEQCNYEHDCGACRRVENFGVGQNMYKRTFTSKKSLSSPNWDGMIKSFYEEVINFNKKAIDPYLTTSAMISQKGKTYGHFSQVVWAQSWRLGCGYVVIEKSKNYYEELLGCNYGPSGNVMGRSMYKPGKPCSDCPSNSCCGKSCGKPDYDGLCKMKKDEFPSHTRTEKSLLYCDFTTLNGDCRATFNGPQWKYVKALGNPFGEIVLQGGKSSTLVLSTSIKPKDKKGFCALVKYRSGPDVAGGTFNNEAVLNFEYGKSKRESKLPKKSNSLGFFTYKISYFNIPEVKISLTFSVPRGAPPQFFNIHVINVYDGKC